MTTPLKTIVPTYETPAFVAVDLSAEPERQYAGVAPAESHSAGYLTTPALVLEEAKPVDTSDYSTPTEQLETPAPGGSYVDTVKSGAATIANTLSNATHAAANTLNQTIIPTAQGLVSSAATAAASTATQARDVLMPKAQELATATANQTRDVVIPKAQELASSAAAQTRDVVIPKAQEMASSAASTAASTASATAAKAREITAISTTPTHHFTTPASSAPMEAHYEINPTASPTQSSPVTFVGVTYPEVTGSPTASSTSTGIARAGEIAGSAVGAVGGAARGAASYVQGSLPTVSSGAEHSQTSYAARAGELTGAAAGAVGGTISTAAAMAKEVVFGSSTSASRDVHVEGETRPGLLATTGAKATEAAGAVAGSIATVAGAAKNAASAVVGKVYGGTSSAETRYV